MMSFLKGQLYLGDVIPKETRARILEWMYTLFTHDNNQTQTILRAATALGYGLDPEKYVSQYPGSTTNVVISAPVAPPTDAAVTPTRVEAAPVRATESLVSTMVSPTPGAVPTPIQVESRVSPPVAQVAPVTQNRQPRRSWLPMILGGLLVAAASGGAVWGISNWTNKSKQSPTSPTPVDEDRNWQLRIVP